MPHPQILRDMALFVEVAKRRSFSQAAAALGMPISSLSRRITLFEAAVGLRLLDRTTRKLVLTSYGEAYLAQATRLVEEAQKTFDDMVAEAKGPTGMLKIAAPPDFWVLRHFSGLVTEFSRNFEHIHVHIDLKPAPIDLAGENYDLAVTIEEPRETSLIVRKIADVHNALFASPIYFATRERPEVPGDLANHQLVLSSPTGLSNLSLARDSETAEVSVRGPISCNNQSLARRLAIAGQGITGANIISVDRDLASGRLERVLPEWRLAPTPVYIVTTSRLLPAKSRSFIDFVTKRLGAVLGAANRGASGPAAHRLEAPAVYAVRS
ncbi:HTH-type transcriptional regulator DmlR [Methylobacterium organophilum]|uniref:HTH-type transcriptional regulator DmlR n=2 Tax=Methylobacterium organophilum TaxID=410 RepID=A0ABQ4T646_METOR|nr:HTH-type transcriptional regulator DmlR [Methylobacterium organophilum]